MMHFINNVPAQFNTNYNNVCVETVVGIWEKCLIIFIVTFCVHVHLSSYLVLLVLR